MLKVAIIGLGTISKIHKAAIDEIDCCELVAVCDINPSTKEAFVGVPFYEDIDEMFKSEKIDCVHICLPHFLHVDAIIKCAKAGVNVFTEKPLGINYEQTTKLFSLEQECGVKIGVCFQNRYNTTSVMMKDIMNSNEYGKFLGSKGIVTWKRTMDYYNASPWRMKELEAGGGVMINQSIHTLDLLYHIGGDIECLEGKISNLSLKDIEVEDTVVANLAYKNDANAIYFATVGYADNSEVMLEFVFEDAVFTISDNELHKKQGGKNEFLCENQKLEGSKHYYGASHQIAILEFYKAIINDTSEYVSVQDAAVSIKLIDSIAKSSKTNSKIYL